MFSDDATASVSQQADADSAAGIQESEIPSIIRRSNREKLLRLLPQFSHVMTVSNREWTASEISTCLHGLRVCTMHDKDALSFLVAIARKSSQLRATKFNTTHVALSLIGMQHLEANSKVVAVMMRFLANNYEPAPNARPNLAAILLALQSLQTKMNSSADTDRLLALLTLELQSNREVMTGVEISRAFDVIKRSTNKRSRTVHGFLAVLVEKLEKAKQLLNFSPSTLTYIFNSLQDLRVSDFPELKKLLKLLVPYIPVAHCAEAFQTKHLGLSLFGLRQMSSGNCLRHGLRFVVLILLLSEVREVRSVLDEFTKIVAERNQLLEQLKSDGGGSSKVRSDAVRTLNVRFDGNADSLLLDKNAMTRVFLGLGKMSSNHIEVRHFLIEMTKLMAFSTPQLPATFSERTDPGAADSDSSTARSVGADLSSMFDGTYDEYIVWDNEDLYGHMLFGLRNMRSNNLPTRNVLQLICDNAEAYCKHPFSEKTAVLAMYGLQGMNTSQPSVVEAVSKLTPFIVYGYDGTLNAATAPTPWPASQIAMFMTGLRRMSSEYECVRNLLHHAYTHMDRTQDDFSARDISMCLFGLSSCTRCPEVFALLSKLHVKIIMCKEAFSPMDIALSLYGLRSMSCDDRIVAKIMGALAVRIENCNGGSEFKEITPGTENVKTGRDSSQRLPGDKIFTAQKLGMCLYGLNQMGSQRSEVLHVVKALVGLVARCQPASASAVYDNGSTSGTNSRRDRAGDFGLDEASLASCLYGLKCLSSREFEVKDLISSLTKLIERSDFTFSSHKHVTMCMFGLQSVNSNVNVVRSLLKVLGDKLYQSSSAGTENNADSRRSRRIKMDKIDALCIGNSLFGFQKLSSSEKEVVRLLEWFEPRILEPSSEDYTPQLVSNAIFGLQRCSSDIPVVRRILSHFTQLLPRVIHDMSNQEISNCLYGLQSMNVQHEEVKALLQCLKGEFEVAKHDVSRQSLELTISYLPPDMRDSEEIHSILNTFPEATVTRIESNPGVSDTNGPVSSQENSQRMAVSTAPEARVDVRQTDHEESVNYYHTASNKGDFGYQKLPDSLRMLTTDSAAYSGGRQYLY
jgi:hypothetical protein